jgi:hypothetical protein
MEPTSPVKSLANTVKIPAFGGKKRGAEAPGPSPRAAAMVKASDIEQELKEPALSELDSSNQ